MQNITRVFTDSGNILQKQWKYHIKKFMTTDFSSVIVSDESRIIIDDERNFRFLHGNNLIIKLDRNVE